MNIAPPPTDPDAYVEDQAVRFHRPFRAKTLETEASGEQKAQESKRPQPTDWRFGPAQYWYEFKIFIYRVSHVALTDFEALF